MNDPLWSIGSPDDIGPTTFGGSWSGPVLRYRIDRDVPGTSWPAFHPGPLNAGTGWREHRAEITFTVPDDPPPPNGWLLELRFAAGHGPCPDLWVELDGRHRGLFHPEVRRDDRSEVYRHGPIAGDVALDVRLPGPLMPGEHVLALTSTVDATSATGPLPVPEMPGRHREQYGHHFGSGLTWHMLALRHAQDAGPDASTCVLAVTPLYPVGTPQRVLLELTVMVPPDVSWPKKSTVDVNGRSYHVKLTRPDRTFGQVRVRFPVPELTGPTRAAVRLDGGPATEYVLRPVRKWTIHLIPHVHLDVGYTDVQGKVLELHSRNLDRALSLVDGAGRFAFSVDGALVVREYLATRAPAQVRRLVAALRDGSLSMNAFHSLFLSGVASLEEVYRAAYLAAELRDRYDIPVRYANLTDVPSYSAALPAILRELGIDAFVGIENHHRGGNADSDTQHLLSPVVWEGIGGERVLAHFSDTYSQLRFMAGDPQTVVGGEQALSRLLTRYERPDCLPHDLPVIGTHADNEDLADGDVGFAARWNALYAYPHIELSTIGGYLDAIRPLAHELPVWRGDGGGYWEDGVGTAAAVVAEHRRAQTALPAAESLAALVWRTDRRYRPHRTVLDAAWNDLLYGSEHTWTWSHATAHPHGGQVADQLDWKRHRVHAAYRTALDETRRTASQLGELVSTDGPTLLAYNPLGWKRDVDVEFEAMAGTVVRLGPGGPALPAEVLTDCAGLHRYRLRVPDVPPYGYRALPVADPRRLAPGDEGGAVSPIASPTVGDDDWQAVPPQLETKRWEACLDPDTGEVTGLRHRTTGRQLLDPAVPWRLGTVLYAVHGPDTLTRGTGTAQEGPRHTGTPHIHPPASASTLLARRPVAPPPDLAVTAAAMRPVGARRTADGWRIRAVGSAPSLPNVEVDVLLRDNDDRIDVTVRLNKEPVLDKESVYVVFPFASDRPRIRYDRQQGWINPAADHAPGACNEWFTTQHGVVVDSVDGGPAVVWTSADAPLFTVGDLVRGTWARHFAPANGTLLSWVMNNYWPTNTPPEQAGPLTLRYAFAPLPEYDPAAASRFGLSVRCPAVVTEVTQLDKFDTAPRTLPAGAGTLLDLDLPDHVHATVAAARDGRGLLVRLQNLTGAATRVDLPHPAGPDGRAVRCTADERDLTPLPAGANPDTVHIDLAPWQVATIKLLDPNPPS